MVFVVEADEQAHPRRVRARARDNRRASAAGGVGKDVVRARAKDQRRATHDARALRRRPSSSSAEASPARRLPGRRRKSVRFTLPPDEDVARSLEDHEYYWQAFPAAAGFWERFGWALDLSMAWRGSGE